MAANTFVEINFAKAADLADLAGAQFDLNSARFLSKALKDNLETPNPNYSLVDPYSTAILVRYSRPFVTNKNKGDATIFHRYEYTGIPPYQGRGSMTAYGFCF